MLQDPWAMVHFSWTSGSLRSAVQAPLSIAYKELFPVVEVACLWGPLWVTKWDKFLCNKEAVVLALKSGTCGDRNVMVLLCHLWLLAVRHSFSFTSSSV